MNIIIDYIVTSFKSNVMKKLYELLNLYEVEFIDIKSFYGYKYCIYYGGIRIHYNTDDDNAVTEVILDCSGKGCRCLESLNPNLDWFVLLNTFDSMYRDGSAHIARLDVACDDTDGVLSMEQMKRYAVRGQYVCRSKLTPLIKIMREESIYFGSPSSDRFLRIYDKALEQGIAGDVHWLRLEFQLRNDNAMSFYLNWLENRDDIGKLYCGVMIDYLRFVQIPNGKNIENYKRNEHLDRLQTAVWWNKFLHNAERIKQLYLPGEEYTINMLAHYVRKQANSSVKTYLIAQGGDIGTYVDDLNRTPLNKRQIDLLNSLKLSDKDIEI